MLLQNRAERDVDIPGKAFTLESSVCDIVHLRTSYAKAGLEAEGTARAAADYRAASMHNNEMRGIAGNRGTESPTNGCTCCVVIVFDLAVSGAASPHRQFDAHQRGQKMCAFLIILKRAICAFNGSRYSLVTCISSVLAFKPQ